MRRPRKRGFSPPVYSFIVVFSLLAVIQVKLKSPRPMLMVERYFPGWGWIEVLLASAYAFWLTTRMQDVNASPLWRRRAWRLFSAVFFGQLLFGLMGAQKFLMTGKLHLPVPAMILAGPLYRGKITFMLILFLSTVLLAGPAWCSHLCYFGTWDDAAATRRRRPGPLPPWRQALRVTILILVITSALGCSALGVPAGPATLLGTFFGIAGVAVMLSWSKKSGQMTHCLTICPVGLLADWLGQVNPFRVRLGPGCDGCGACATACRYDALRPEDIRRRKPGLSCSLCGDCLRACPAGAIHYRFCSLRPRAARTVFVVVLVSIHSLFLVLARI